MEIVFRIENLRLALGSLLKPYFILWVKGLSVKKAILCRIIHQQTDFLHNLRHRRPFEKKKPFLAIFQTASPHCACLSEHLVIVSTSNHCFFVPRI